jgi:hypothetical protein
MHHELSANGITDNEVVGSKHRDVVLEGFIDFEYVINGDREYIGRLWRESFLFVGSVAVTVISINSLTSCEPTRYLCRKVD